MKKKKENIIEEEERKTQDMSAVRDYGGEKSNSAKLVDYLGDDYEDIPAVDNSLEGKAANVWYHYKWPIIIGVFFLVVAFVGINQMVNRVKYDISVMYAGPTVIAGDTSEAVSEALGKITMADVNGDGKTNVKIYSYTYYTDAQIEERKKHGVNVDYQHNVDAYNDFNNMVFTGECGVMFLDYELFSAVRDSGGLVTLESALGRTPEGAIDEYGVKLSELKAYKFYSALQIMPPDTVVCLRGVSTTGGVFTSKKSAEKTFENSKEAFINLMNFEYPEGFEE